MDKEKAKRLGENEQFIKGIYNYCDRWCERCPLSSKCMLYAMDEKEPVDPATRHLDNEKFWNQISDSFRLAIELIEDWAKKEGLDLTVIDAKNPSGDLQKEEQKIRSHPLSKKTKFYIKQVNNWLTDAEPFLKEKEINLDKQVRLNINDQETEKEARQITDFIEVIQWYKLQIHTKIFRALSGKNNEPGDAISVQHDSNGSAKVAMIGIKRSMAAWSKLLKSFPEMEDDILAILVSLERLNNLLEKTFPKAENFIRPGFDEKK